MRGAPTSHRPITLAAVAQLIVIIDSGVLTISLPAISQDLNLSLESLPWIANAYTLTLAATLLVGGRIVDVFGAVPSMRAGLVLFAVASLCAGVAPTFGVFVVFRVFQGLGACLLSPSSLALLTESTHEGRERNHAIAVWTTTATVGGTLSVVAGGTITELFNWRWNLLINVLIAPTLLILSRGMVVHRDRRARRNLAFFDIPGSLLLMAALGGISMAAMGSVPGPLRIAGFAAGGSAVFAFGFVQRHSRYPILALVVLFTRRVGLTNLAALLLMSGFAVLGFYTSIYPQVVVGLSPIQTALSLIPSAVFGVVASLLAPSIIERWGERAVRTASPLLASAAMAAISVVVLRTPPFAVLVPMLVVQSVAASAAVVTLTGAATRSMPKEESGLGGALIASSGQTGAAVGLALLTGVAVAVAGSSGRAVGALDAQLLAVQMSIAVAGGALLALIAAFVASAIPLSQLPGERSDV